MGLPGGGWRRTYEGDFMRRRHLVVAVAIFAAALAFSGCDLLKPPVTSVLPDSDLVIYGEDANKNPVTITFSRPAASKAALTPQTNDNYAINYKDDPKYSSGDITVSADGITITFNETGGGTFRGTYNGGNKLSFPDNRIGTSTPIDGFKVKENGGNSAAKTAAEQLDKSLKNATPDGNNVIISGEITVLSDVVIPDSVKLVFNSRNNETFTIKKSDSSSSASVTVTAKGGIEVSGGRGVKITGNGALVVEGDATITDIKGRLIVDGGATLDIAGIATIYDEGVLELSGDKTAREVGNYKYGRSDTIPPYYDAKFILRGKGTANPNLIVKKGGRFQMPDPYRWFDNRITGVIRVEAGGELILVTSDPNGKKDLHPWIGTEYTATQGAPIGADFVMYPSDQTTDNWIEIRFTGYIPALELTGAAAALGRLILNEEYNEPMRLYDNRSPPYRYEVWLTYPFTVTNKSVLTIGNSEERYKFSALLVTGDNTYKNPDDGSTLRSRIKGINKGVLTNNGKINVQKKNAIVEWFGGYFNHRGEVYDSTGAKKLNAVTNPLIKEDDEDPPNEYADWGPYGPIKINVWSPEWKENWSNEGPPPGWWSDGLGKYPTPSTWEDADDKIPGLKPKT